MKNIACMKCVITLSENHTMNLISPEKHAEPSEPSTMGGQDRILSSIELVLQYSIFA